MALQKTKTLTNGISGNYWKITGYSIDKQGMTITYSVNLFVSQEYTTTKPIIGLNKAFSFPVTKEQLAGDLISLGYTNILTKANSVVSAAVEAQAAVAYVPANGATPAAQAKRAIDAKPIVYGDADLQGATAV